MYSPDIFSRVLTTNEIKPARFKFLERDLYLPWKVFHWSRTRGFDTNLNFYQKIYFYKITIAKLKCWSSHSVSSSQVFSYMLNHWSLLNCTQFKVNLKCSKKPTKTSKWKKVRTSVFTIFCFPMCYRQGGWREKICCLIICLGKAWFNS